MSRYKVVGSAAESEPGSNGLVLSNRLGITDPAVMEVVERDLLLDLYQTIIGNGAPTNRLSVSDLIDWHSRVFIFCQICSSLSNRSTWVG